MAHPLELVRSEVRQASDALNNATVEVAEWQRRETDATNRLADARKAQAAALKLYDEAVAKMDAVVGRPRRA